MRLIFLGTSAGAPTRERNVSSTALQLDSGEVWLVDCGEGTQHQILRTPLRPGRVRKILLTHLHGDHCFGLPGLLASMGLHGATEPVEIISPPGARAFLTAALEASMSTLPFALRFRELEGEAHFHEEDGTRLAAVPIVHRVPCFGFVVRTPERRGRLDVGAARARGVTLGTDLGKLARGEDVVLPAGGTLPARDVLGPPRRGVHAVILGDTSDPGDLAPLAQGCDVLVHEATYDASLTHKALEFGHSTAAMAGAFAARVEARRLVLTHFSARYNNPAAERQTEDLGQEAASACPGTEVLTAYDLMSLEVSAPD